MKLGSAFSDSLVIERKTVNRLGKISQPAWWLGAGRPLLFASILLVVFFVLVFRLFDLTIIQGHRFRALADENRIRELIRHAPRGLMLDRTGKPVVANIPNFRLVRPCTNMGTLCTVRLSQEVGELLQRQGLPIGEFLEVDYQRQYIYGSALAHVLGYTGELNWEELADDYYTLRKYRAGDRVGRGGVEAVFEERLRGRDGRELVEVDAEGVVTRTLGRDAEVRGNTVTLSLDADLSEAVANAFPEGERGAVIVSRPATGELLALYSSPSYNPNLFSAGISEDDFKLLFESPQRPLFNRAIGGVYPPGSTYKIITSLAALYEGAVKAETLVEDVGVIRIGERFSFPNWYFLKYGKTEGMVDMVKALARSNDIYFYKVGEWLGITKLAAWARKFGIGRPLGVELAGEAGGLMPDPAWKNERFTSPADLAAGNNQWYLGDTYHVAIGQGYLLATPLHVNMWTAAVANRGKLCRPTIEKVTSDAKAKKNCIDLGLKQESIRVVSEGMRMACSAGGTGWPLFNFKVQNSKLKIEEKESSPSAQTPGILVPVACKTGTAEYGDPKGNTHAWFTVFAPLRSIDSRSQDIKTDQEISGEPEVAVTVLVEGAGEGSEIAAPIAKKILEFWFTR